jgi:HEAT repeat protein
MIKRIFVLAGVLVFTAGVLAAQSTMTGELSVEESYLQQSVELMIIREQSRADSRDMKLVALEYIGDAIARGTAGEEIRASLEYLGTEGTLNQTRENGRLMNNYPDVRVRAATFLGALGTPEAKNTLIKMCYADNEPMVLTEVIKSLGKIGNNDNDETMSVISWVVNRYDILRPDNLLALSALDFYEKFAKSDGGIKNPLAIQTIMSISEGPYIRPVQDRAKQLLADLRENSL